MLIVLDVAMNSEQYQHRFVSREVDEALQKLVPRNAESDCLIYSALLQKVSKANSLSDGRRLHQHLAICGLDKRSTFLANHLINMYGKCGSLEDARSVFDCILEPNRFSWNTMIAAYATNGKLQQARQVFMKMPKKNVVSWNTLLAGLSQKGHVEEAKEMFDKMPQRDIFSWNSMMKAYAQAGDIKKLEEIFKEIPNPDVVSWNTMISAYSHHGHSTQAMQMFKAIAGSSELQPDDVTFLSVIESCSGLADVKFLHEILSRTRWKWALKVCNSLLNMYGCKFHSLEDARDLFDRMPVRDVISWNTMIAACSRCGCGKQGLHYFKLMDLEGQHPDSICLITVLDACESLEVGKRIHGFISCTPLERNLLVGTSLVNLYGNSGCVQLARDSFGMIFEKADVTAWTAIIVAHARNNLGDEALEIFRKFGLEGMQPDEVAFLSIISSCSHAGLLYSGLEFFVALSGDYNVKAQLEHYRCMVDLLGRLGQLGLAEDLITNMPFVPDFVSWVTLLGACKTHGDEEMGQRVAQLASELNPDVASPYVYQFCKK